MSTLVSIDFSGTIGTDFNGTTSIANYTGGDLQFTGEGAILAKTTVGTGNKWMRFKVPTLQDVTNSYAGFALGDSSGNCFIWTFFTYLGSLAMDDIADYSTYTSWNNDTNIEGDAGTFTAGQFLGVTFEVSANTVRVWTNVTAAAPDSVSSWDSGAADWSSTAKTFKSNSNYVGFGTNSSGPATHSFDDFTAGDFGSTQSNAPRVTRHLQNMMRG